MSNEEEPSGTETRFECRAEAEPQNHDVVQTAADEAGLFGAAVTHGQAFSGQEHGDPNILRDSQQAAQHPQFPRTEEPHSVQQAYEQRLRDNHSKPT